MQALAQTVFVDRTDLHGQQREGSTIDKACSSANETAVFLHPELLQVHSDVRVRHRLGPFHHAEVGILKTLQRVLRILVYCIDAKELVTVLLYGKPQVQTRVLA